MFRGVGMSVLSVISQGAACAWSAVGGFCRVRLLGALLVSVLVAGCMPEDGFRRYVGAPGPDLHSRQTVNNTALLRAYTASICEQAGLGNGADGCQIATTADWKNFVDMGLYDIDQRCDTFLDSLYYKDESRDSILAQISDTRTFTGAILKATRSSNIAIDIVAAAFDITEHTFRNTNKTLLDALDPTTVKSLVFRRQQDVKAQIYQTTISNKPQALHALRTYLRVCMPFTIEMEANALLTSSQWTNELGESPILLAAKQLRKDAPDNAFEPIKKTEPPGSGGSNGNGGGGGKPWNTMPESDIEKNYSKDGVQGLQRQLCAKPTGRFDAATRAAIKIAEAEIRSTSANGIIDIGLEEDVIAEEAEGCTALPTGAANTYEKFHFRTDGTLVAEDKIKRFQIALLSCTGTAEQVNAQTLDGKPSESEIQTGKLDDTTRKLVKFLAPSLKNQDDSAANFGRLSAGVLASIQNCTIVPKSN